MPDYRVVPDDHVVANRDLVVDYGKPAESRDEDKCCRDKPTIRFIRPIPGCVAGADEGRSEHGVHNEVPRSTTQTCQVNWFNPPVVRSGNTREYPGIPGDSPTYYCALAGPSPAGSGLRMPTGQPYGPARTQAATVTPPRALTRLPRSASPACGRRPSSGQAIRDRAAVCSPGTGRAALPAGSNSARRAPCRPITHLPQPVAQLLVDGVLVEVVRRIVRGPTQPIGFACDRVRAGRASGSAGPFSSTALLMSKYARADVAAAALGEVVHGSGRRTATTRTTWRNDRTLRRPTAPSRLLTHLDVSISQTPSPLGLPRQEEAQPAEGRTQGPVPRRRVSLGFLAGWACRSWFAPSHLPWTPAGVVPCAGSGAKDADL